MCNDLMFYSTNIVCFFLDVEKSFNQRDTEMKGRETASFQESIFFKLTKKIEIILKSSFL